MGTLSIVGATHYISGPSAQWYIHSTWFQEASIAWEFMRYEYPAHSQPGERFENGLSILGLLFLHNPDSLKYFDLPVQTAPPS